jgi:hypothetical protein
MEVLKVQLARTIWLFDAQELNPKGISLFPEVFHAFGKRYQFGTLPKPEELGAGGSLFFKQGKFVCGPFAVEVDLDLHADGLVASCRHSTEVAHEFLLDCIGFLGEQLALVYPPHITKKRIYRSEVIVQLEAGLGGLSPRVQEFSAFLSNLSQKDVQATGILFGDDGGASPIFTLDRRVNIPWEDNRYFSSSSLPTSQHIEALEKLERIMAA